MPFTATTAPSRSRRAASQRPPHRRAPARQRHPPTAGAGRRRGTRSAGRDSAGRAGRRTRKRTPCRASSATSSYSADRRAGGDDGIARAAVGTGDVRIAVTPVRRVEQLAQAVVADGRSGLIRDCPVAGVVAVPDDETLARRVGRAGHVDRLDRRRRRSLLAQRRYECVERRIRGLRVDVHAVRVVQHPAPHAQPRAETRHERPEPTPCTMPRTLTARATCGLARSDTPASVEADQELLAQEIDVHAAPHRRDLGNGDAGLTFGNSTIFSRAVRDTR